MPPSPTAYTPGAPELSPSAGARPGRARGPHRAAGGERGRTRRARPSIGIPGIDRLHATLRLEPEEDGASSPPVRLVAAMVQIASVSLEPVAQRVAVDIAFRVLPAGREPADGPEHRDEIETGERRRRARRGGSGTVRAGARPLSQGSAWRSGRPTRRAGGPRLGALASLRRKSVAANLPRPKLRLLLRGGLVYSRPLPQTTADCDKKGLGTMAVPKKEVSPSPPPACAGPMRRCRPGPAECPNCGELKRPHHVCSSCGHYDGVRSSPPTAAEGRGPHLSRRAPAGKETQIVSNAFSLAIDAMGGDDAPDIVLDGLELAAERHPQARFLLVGDEARIGAARARRRARASAA